MSDLARRGVFFETAGSVLWFVMDGCWMLELEMPALLLTVPTLAANAAVLRYVGRSFTDIAATAAVNCWVLMNVLSLVSDLRGKEALLPGARLFFFLGATLLLAAALSTRRSGALLERVLGRFRRLRLPRS